MLQKSYASMAWIKGLPDQYWNPAQFINVPFLMMMICFALLWILVPLYFLVTRKEAFDRAVATAGGDLAASSPG
jgi:hypothetical protein